MDERLEKAIKYLQLAQEGSLTVKEARKFIDIVLQAVRVIKENLSSELSSMKALSAREIRNIETALSGMEARLETMVKKVSKETQDKAFKDLNNEVYKLEKMIREIPEFDPSTIETKFSSVISDMHNEMMVMCEPKKLRDGLEKLKGDERLDKSAVRGIDKIEEQIKEIQITPRGGGQSRGLYLFVDGSKKGLVNTVNLVAGTGVTMTYNRSNGRNDITISASGSAFSVSTATGTVNGVNQAFTFASKPVLVVSDGVSYRENNGWTWNSGTLTATMSVPPQSDIYGLA